MSKGCAKAMPDEQTAVVITGSVNSGHSAVLGALLGQSWPIAEAPLGGYVVVSFHPAAVRPAGASRSDPAWALRRIDVGHAHPLLRHLTLIDAPAAGCLSAAGIHVLVDVARRGGAAVFTVRCGDRLTAGESAVLAALVQAGVAVRFALAPDVAGRWRGPGSRGRRIEPPDSDDPAQASLEVYRALVGARVPALAEASWHFVDPAAADAVYLRQALVSWASDEALRRAADSLPPDRGATRVPPGVDARWRTRLDQTHRRAGYAVRHRISLDLAGLHLRCVQHLQRYADPITLLRLLDDELHALSLHADAACDAALTGMLDDVLHAVFTDGVPDRARARLCTAVRNRVAADEIAGALLVTIDGAVVAVPGRAALTALHAYPAAVDVGVLPGTGVALAAECWDPGFPRSLDDVLHYLQRAVDELERALNVEVERRFDAVLRGLRRVVGDAVHAGILAS
jgi:hypothetical protein